MQHHLLRQAGFDGCLVEAIRVADDEAEHREHEVCGPDSGCCPLPLFQNANSSQVPSAGAVQLTTPSVTATSTYESMSKPTTSDDEYAGLSRHAATLSNFGTASLAVTGSGGGPE